MCQLCNTPMTSLPQLVCPSTNEVLHRPTIRHPIASLCKEQSAVDCPRPKRTVTTNGPARSKSRDLLHKPRVRQLRPGGLCREEAKAGSVCERETVLAEVAANAEASREIKNLPQEPKCRPVVEHCDRPHPPMQRERTRR